MFASNFQSNLAKCSVNESFSALPSLALFNELERQNVQAITITITSLISFESVTIQSILLSIVTMHVKAKKFIAIYFGFTIKLDLKEL